MKNDVVKLIEKLSKLDKEMIELEESIRDVRIEICHLFWQAVENKKGEHIAGKS